MVDSTADEQDGTTAGEKYDRASVPGQILWTVLWSFVPCEKGDSVVVIVAE